MPLPDDTPKYYTSYYNLSSSLACSRMLDSVSACLDSTSRVICFTAIVFSFNSDQLVVLTYQSMDKRERFQDRENAEVVLKFVKYMQKLAKLYNTCYYIPLNCGSFIMIWYRFGENNENHWSIQS